MIKGFRDFIMRGNVVDLAVAVVIGGAVSLLVKDFTTAFINPLIALLLPGDGDVAGTVTIDGQVFDYGLFITSVITFLITAVAVYFFIVVPMNKMKSRMATSTDAGPTDIDLLTEIRDELRRRG